MLGLRGQEEASVLNLTVTGEYNLFTFDVIENSCSYFQDFFMGLCISFLFFVFVSFFL